MACADRSFSISSVDGSKFSRFADARAPTSAATVALTVTVAMMVLVLALRPQVPVPVPPAQPRRPNRGSARRTPSASSSSMRRAWRCQHCR